MPTEVVRRTEFVRIREHGAFRRLSDSHVLGPEGRVPTEVMQITEVVSSRGWVPLSQTQRFAHPRPGGAHAD